MTNIPTDLLRTLIAVVDLRSFTKAAHAMGVTQPAVSAQIKRLQSLLGSDLLDKSAPGVALTPTGDLVVNYARRLLSINDQILNLAGPRPNAQTLRIGVPPDCILPSLSDALSRLLKQWPDIRFDLRSASSETLMQDLGTGDLDIMVALSVEDPGPLAFESWPEPLAWIRSDATRLDPAAPVPLVACDADSVSYRVAVETLNRAGRGAALVFTSSYSAGLMTAVTAGIGLMVSARNRPAPDIFAWENPPLPSLPDVFRGIYLGEGRDRVTLERVAETMAGALRPAMHTDRAVHA
jgi:DNA-binding transcriptional LysR family regulator